MKIIDKTKTKKPLRFKDLQIGDIYKSSITDYFYMRIENCIKQGYNKNSILLRENNIGILIDHDLDSIVEKVECELHIL